MEILRTYLKTKTPAEQVGFAVRCGTTIGYLRKCLSTGQRIGESIVIAMERESAGKITCEAMRPDVDWRVLRGPSRRKRAG